MNDVKKKEDEEVKIFIEKKCTICHDDNIGEIRILKCNHCYHIQCLNKWMEQKYNTCPLCRVNIE